MLPDFDDNGYLLLGSSENLGGSAGYFSLLDRHNKVYAKKPASGRPVLQAAPKVPPRPFPE